MNDMSSPELLRVAVEGQDLEGGIEIVDSISDWSEMERAIALLRGQEMRSASAFYLLGHLWVRYEKWADAYLCFLTAAELGLNSALYRAGQITRDHGPEVGSAASRAASELFTAAAENGHIWSKQILLKEKAKSSITAKFVWWAHRFIILPLHLLSSAVFKSRRDNMRY